MYLVNNANNCGHKFCPSCIERELSKKRQFSCPRCKMMVSRDKLSEKGLDETEVERDFRIRKKIKAIYNKVELDFDDVLKYKDYEEEVEDLIYNLVNSIDVEKTNQAVDNYKKTNAEKITVNQFKKSELIREESNIIKEQEEIRISNDIAFQVSLLLLKLTNIY